MALGVSLDFYGEKYDNQRAKILAETLDEATEQFLDNDRSPSRKVNELDTRGSHFYLGYYWAKALAQQDSDTELKGIFEKVSQELDDKKDAILAELLDAQGEPQGIGGYYKPDDGLASNAMRPSQSFNSILEGI